MGRKNIIATYGMIKNYKNQPSCNWLTLAEFIDNSIASYQYKNDKNPIEGLEISIEYKYTSDDNVKIIISDNANGMDEDELANAMQPSDRRGKKDNQYNQYGVGMKLGIFWNGQDGTVYSKQKNKKEYVVELKTSDKNEGEEVFVESTKSKDDVIKYESGTTVIIDKVYDNRKLKSGEIDEISKALGWRYNKLLDNQDSYDNYRKGMKIRIYVDHPDSRIDSYNKVINVKPFFIKPFTFNDFLDYKKTSKTFDMTKFLNNYQIEIENIKNEYKDDKNYQILIEFCDKFLAKQPLFSNRMIRVNNQSVIINFGLISETSRDENGAFGNISGVTTYHIKRAINHGPRSRKNSQNCIQFNVNASNISAGDPTWRRLYGDIDLTNVEVPDQNKSRFDWSPTGYEDLSRELKKIWDALKPLLNIIANKFENYTNAVVLTNIKDKQKLVKSTFDSINQDVIKSDIQVCPETNKQEPCFIYNTGNKRFFIIEDNEKTTFIKTTGSTENDTDIYIYFNQNHPFWKPYINDVKNNVEFRGNSIYPIILLVAICNDCLMQKDYTEFLTDSIGPGYTLEEIINDVVSHIEKREH